MFGIRLTRMPTDKSVRPTAPSCTFGFCCSQESQALVEAIVPMSCSWGVARVGLSDCHRSKDRKFMFTINMSATSMLQKPSYLSGDHLPRPDDASELASHPDWWEEICVIVSVQTLAVMIAIIIVVTIVIIVATLVCITVTILTIIKVTGIVIS